MRATRHAGRLLAATAICLVYPTPAVAGDYGITSEDATPVLIASGETVEGDKSGVYSTGTELNLTNEGTIRGNGLNAFTSNTDAGIAFKGGPATITNSGDISGARFGISSFYFFTDFSDPENPVWDGRAIGSTLTNSGSIIGDSDDGVRFIGGGTVTNSGYIAGRVGSLADGISMFSFEGQDLTSFTEIGSVTNLAGGTIEGNRFGIIMSNGGTIDNAGTISGNSGSIHIQAQTFDTGRSASVTNSGTLNGTVSFNGLANASVINSGSIIATNGWGIHADFGMGDLSVVNQETGSITGSTSGIYSQASTLSLINHGTIRGDGTFDGFGATPDGGVTVSGGPATIQNYGSITGQRFGITTIYSWDPETEQLDGLAIGSTVENDGTIIGDSDDGIRLIGGGTVANSGYIAGRVGPSADGVSMFAFDTQSLDSFVEIGTVTNLAEGEIAGNRFGIILSGGGSVDNAGSVTGNVGGIQIQAFPNDPGRAGNVVNSGEISGSVSFFGLADAFVENSGTIIGATSGILDASDALTVDNSGTIRGNGLNAFTSNTDAGIAFKGGPATITNSGDISGARFGISSFYFFTDFSDPDNPVWDGRAIGSTLTNSGSIIGDTDDGVRFIGGGTITNSGYIAGRVGAGADGISMFSFEGQDLTSFSEIGSVTNLAGGVIEGNRFGIIMSNGGSVDNAGTISGNSGSIHIQAQTFDPGRTGQVTNSGTLNGTVSFFGLASASVENSGTIVGATSGIQNDSASLAVDNSGTIRGNGTNSSFSDPNAGIMLRGGPGDIDNSGSISGASFGITTAYGIDEDDNLFGLAIGSSILNSGSIIGDSNDGIRLIGGGDVTNSGTIAGRVGGGADGISMFSYDDQDLTSFTQIGTVTNLAGGVIEGNRYGIIMSNGGTITNAGSISGNTGAIHIQAQLFDPGRAGLVANTGTVNGTVSFFGLESASVENSGSITGATSGIMSYASSLSVNNAGTIRANGSYDGFEASPDGGIDLAGGPGTIDNSGTISGQRFGVTTSYMFNDATQQLEGRAVGTTVTNSGSILGDTDIGIRLIGGGSVTNSGYIAGRVGPSADGVWMMAYNDQPLGSFTQIGTVTNLAGGVIEGDRRGVTLANGGTVDNAGTISGDVAGIRIVALAGDPGRTGDVLNSGTINGTVEFIGLAGATLGNSGWIESGIGAGVHTDGVLSVTNAATGYISGGTRGISSSGTSLSVDNAGAIIGYGLNTFTSNTDAGIAFNGGPATITNSGFIHGTRFGVSSFYYFTDFSDPDNPVWDGRAIGSTLTNSGSILGQTDDGVRFIGGGTITNSGYIAGRFGGDGISMFAFEGQDLTSFAQIGSVTNLAGGVIEGSRLGIILSNGGTVDNAGTINGGTSGAVTIQAISTDPGRTGNVTNSGTISGQVAFLGLAESTVTNSGSISATNDSAVYGTGTLTVTNDETGSIASTGPSFDLASGIFSENGLVALENAGEISGSFAGVFLGESGSGDITNSGLIWGGVVGLNGGWQGGTVTINNSGSIVGASNGCCGIDIGNGTIINSGSISGAGLGISSSGTIINSGSISGQTAISATGAMTLVNSGTITATAVPAIAVQLSDFNDSVTLQTGSSINGAVVGGNGTDSVTLSGTINSPTALQRIPHFNGFETLNVLSGYWTAAINAGGFLSTTISGGTLAINSAINSPIAVSPAARLGGTGTIIGNVTVNGAGILAPGNSIGTLNVTGNVNFGAGSIFQVETTPSGLGDQLAVNGNVTIGNGASVQVLAGSVTSEGYAAFTQYTILTANSISGKFGSVTSDLAFLKPILAHKNNSIMLTLSRNGRPLTSASTATTFGTASAVAAFDEGNPIYQAVLLQSDSGARQAFSALSGSAYGALDMLIAGELGHVRLGLEDGQAESPALEWAGGAAHPQAFSAGSAAALGPVAVMVNGGTADRSVATHNAAGETRSRFLASGVGYRSGRFQALGAISAGWHEVAAMRTVSFPGFAEQLRSDYRVETRRLDGELSYTLARGAFALAPYAAYSNIFIKTPAFHEFGGASALAYSQDSRVIDQLGVGVRMKGRLDVAGIAVVPRLDLSMRHAWGDIDGRRQARFLSGGAEFDSFGEAVAAKSAAIDAGVELTLGALSVNGSYRGELSEQGDDHSGILRASLRF